MKLIDKEKIRYTDLAEGQCPDGVWVAWKDWIDKIPTVEAIPVEWLSKHGFFEILDLWVSENTN